MTAPAAATAHAAADVGAALLPPEVVAHVFSLLPFNTQHMTVALLSKSWHGWALRQRGGSPSFRPRRLQVVPAHAVMPVWRSPGRLTDPRQQAHVLACAAREGDLELLQGLCLQQLPWAAVDLPVIRELYKDRYKPVCEAAAAGGHLHVLAWLRSSKRSPCPWDEGTFTAAVREKQLEVMQWLRSQDPPCPWSESACGEAARKWDLGR